MDKIEKIHQKIKELYDGEAPKHDQQCDFSDGYFTGLGVISKFLDTLSEEPDESLEEAAENYTDSSEWLIGENLEHIEAAFIAGAEWQKEQDQPITGNSLEQEWLRYVDRKMKENEGELPALGEYGWLQIARHFAEWQKSQMLKDAEECELYWDGDFLAIDLNMAALGYSERDKVKVIVLKEKEGSK